MSVSRRQMLSLSAGAGLALLASQRAANQWLTSVHAAPLPDFPAPDPITIALNRLAYGPTPVERAEIQRVGLGRWIETQLNPPVGDAPAVRAKLAAATFPMRVRTGGNKEKPAGERRRGDYTREDRPLEYLEAPQEVLWQLVLDGRNNEQRQLAQRPANEVRVATWLRATYSPWQLQEVLTEFWHNHFSIDITADRRRIPAIWPAYDRVMRTHALGNFREFLEAVASAPAMLYYLDNATSKASPANENYARELFELHTLGEEAYLADCTAWDQVPGASAGNPAGFIDADVLDAARALTGWTVADARALRAGMQGRNPRQRRQRLQNLPNATGEFFIQADWHDTDTKRILGATFPAGVDALTEGRRVLDLAAYHPATARFVCTKLCRRFIADQPPSEVVQAAVDTWMDTQRDPHQLREVVRTIATHPKFTQGWGAKVKSPFELMVSFFRGTAADVTPSAQLLGSLDNLGYDHFTFPAPAGRPDTAGYWLSTNGLLGRWNLLESVLGQRFNTATFDFAAATPAGLRTADAVIDHWSDRLLGHQLTDTSRAAILNAVGQVGTLQGPRLGQTIAIIAMTPEYQRR